jgi:serine/threonine-protein kinase
VLYEMLTGRLAFDGDTPIAIALKHLHEPPPRPRAVQPDVPMRLEGVVVKAMAKRPEDRYATARDLATDLAGETEFWKAVVNDDLDATREFTVDDQTLQRRARMNLLRVASVVLVAVGVALGIAWRAADNYLTVPEVEMPSLVGRPLREAEQLAQEAGVILEVADRVNTPRVPPEVVVSQDQPPGKRLKQGRRVGIVVSLGAQLVTVPNLVQRSVQEAQLALDNARLRVGALQDGYDDLVKAGLVIRQSPAAGATVPVDTPVTLVISRGPPLVDMPALAGRTLEEARTLLEEKGLVITHLRTVGTAEAEPGRVLEQTPSAGTRMRPGEGTITLTVSARPGEESAPPSVPVITAEPQPVETPPAPPRATPRPTPPQATPAPGPVSPRPTAATSPGQVRRTRIQVVVPGGGSQDVRIVVIDETGVHTVYEARHSPGDRVDQVVRSQGYTIIQVYIANRLVQEVRP